MRLMKISITNQTLSVRTVAPRPEQIFWKQTVTASFQIHYTIKKTLMYDKH